MSYNPAFSKVLYVVPTVNGEGDNDNTNTVSDALLAGGSIFSAGTTLHNDANGVSSTQRGFRPVNAGLTQTALTDAANDTSATPSPSRGDGIDYGDYDDNLAAQRLQAWRQTGPGATAAGAQRQDASHAATAGPDGSSIINVAVYGSVRT